MDEEIYILIAKALSNEASPEELRLLQAWLDADAGNKAAYEEVRLLWQHADTMLEQPQFDTAAAWEKVAMQTVDIDAAPKPPTFVLPAWLKLGGIAAMLAAVFFGYRFFTATADISVTATEDKKIILPDQSVVQLKKGSTLIYPAAFTTSERHITLTGEAFFEVTRREDQPFTIDADPVDVKVLGTSFNVICNKDLAQVVVATGKVAVTAAVHPAQSVELTPGEGATFENGSLHETLDTNITYYRTGRLSFADRPLSEVIRTIGQVKGVRVLLDTALPAAIREQLINDTFSGRVEAMLDDLCAYSKGIRWVKKGDHYLITVK